MVSNFVIGLLLAVQQSAAKPPSGENNVLAAEAARVASWKRFLDSAWPDQAKLVFVVPGRGSAPMPLRSGAWSPSAEEIALVVTRRESKRSGDLLLLVPSETGDQPFGASFLVGSLLEAGVSQIEALLTNPVKYDDVPKTLRSPLLQSAAWSPGVASRAASDETLFELSLALGARFYDPKARRWIEAFVDANTATKLPVPTSTTAGSDGAGKPSKELAAGKVIRLQLLIDSARAAGEPNFDIDDRLLDAIVYVRGNLTGNELRTAVLETGKARAPRLAQEVVDYKARLIELLATLSEGTKNSVVRKIGGREVTVSDVLGGFDVSIEDLAGTYFADSYRDLPAGTKVRLGLAIGFWASAPGFSPLQNGMTPNKSLVFVGPAFPVGGQPPPEK